MQKVLIVDDERNIRNVLDFSLGAEGYRVLEACDGLEAMVMARREHPDLIILDVMMPFVDGFEVCRRLKDDRRTSSIPVILLTARSNRDDRHQGERMKADAYITKPFSPNRLLETVHSLLGVPKG